MKPEKKIAYWHIVSILAGLAVLITFFVGAQLSPWLQRLLVAAWLVVPPAFFFAEYHLQTGTLSEGELARMRVSQELARNIWAGIATALAVLYLKGS